MIYNYAGENKKFNVFFKKWKYDVTAATHPHSYPGIVYNSIPTSYYRVQHKTQHIKKNKNNIIPTDILHCIFPSSL